MKPSPQAAARLSTADENEVESKSRTFGDPIGVKQKNSVRIMFQNVNGFGYTKKV